MPDVMLVGEAFGRQEEQEGRPFVGASGWLLNDCLAAAGIARSDCYVTNVFMLRPQDNDLKYLCGPKADAIPGLPALTKGKYASSKYIPELQRLYKEIDRVQPNLIIALGATAAWALLHTGGIKSIRGACTTTHPAAGKALGTPLSRQYKVLPTYHPAAVIRDYSLRPILIADLGKGERNRAFSGVIRPRRDIWIEPELVDLPLFEANYIAGCERVSTDIETMGDQITCIGFAPTPDIGIVVPFFCWGKEGNNYWPTLREELSAWHWVKHICETYPSIFQNGLYDMHRLWRTYGIKCRPADDTMLLHHAMQPEMEKSLGFLGTIYTDEASWKIMRKDAETLKKED